MSLLDRLRSWLGGGDDRDATTESAGGDDTADGSAGATDGEASEPAGLDPDNVKRTRTAGDDGDTDPVEQLQQLRDEAERDEDG